MHVNYSIWGWVGASNNDPGQGLYTFKSSPDKYHIMLYHIAPHCERCSAFSRWSPPSPRSRTGWARHLCWGSCWYLPWTTHPWSDCPRTGTPSVDCHRPPSVVATCTAYVRYQQCYFSCCFSVSVSVTVVIFQLQFQLQLCIFFYFSVKLQLQLLFFSFYFSYYFFKLQLWFFCMKFA